MSLRMQALEMILGASGASAPVAGHFADRNAHSPETAIPFTPCGERQRRQFGMLRSRGAIVDSGTRYYLDRPRFDAMRVRQRRVQAAVWVAIAALLVVAVLALTRP